MARLLDPEASTASSGSGHPDGSHAWPKRRSADSPATNVPTYLHLYDGAPVNILRTAIAPPSMNDLFPDECVLISVDASAQPGDRASHIADTRRFTDYVREQQVGSRQLLHERSVVRPGKNERGPSLNRYGNPGL